MGKIKSVGGAVKRPGFELLVLLLMVLLAIMFSNYLDTIAAFNFLASIASVAIRVSCGIIQAHISRKLIFPYIDFNVETHWAKSLIIVVWYPVIILAWARGG